MFKNVKRVIAFSIILFLAGVFFLVMSNNEINRVTADFNDEYNEEYLITTYSKMKFTSNIPLQFEYIHSDVLSVKAINIKTEYIKILNSAEGEVTFSYNIPDDNMDVLFIPAINRLKSTVPRIIISLPEGYDTQNYTSKGIGWSFNLASAFQSKTYLATDISFSIAESENDGSYEVYSDSVESYTAYSEAAEPHTVPSLIPPESPEAPEIP